MLDHLNLMGSLSSLENERLEASNLVRFSDNVQIRVVTVITGNDLCV